MGVVYGKELGGEELVEHERAAGRFCMQDRGHAVRLAEALGVELRFTEFGGNPGFEFTYGGEQWAQCVDKGASPVLVDNFLPMQACQTMLALVASGRITGKVRA